MSTPTPREPHAHPVPAEKPESGKIGLAILMWLLGVPGSIILLYLIFAH